MREARQNSDGDRSSDPCGALAEDQGGTMSPQSVTGMAVTRPDGTMASDADNRADPNRFHDKRDDGVKAALRGRKS